MNQICLFNFFLSSQIDGVIRYLVSLASLLIIDRSSCLNLPNAGVQALSTIAFHFYFTQLSILNGSASQFFIFL